MELPLIGKSQTQPGVKILPWDSADLFDIRQSCAMHSLQLVIEDFLIFSGRQEQIAVNASKLAVNIFFPDQGFDAVNGRCVAFCRKTSSPLAVQALDLVVAIVDRIGEMSGGC